MVKQAKDNLDLSKTPGPDYIPVVFLKNYESKLSYIAQLLKMCLKKACFLDFWKISSAISVIKNVKEKSTVKNCNSGS